MTYDIELGLKNFAVLTDWHPFKGSFRLTGGVVFNGNRLDLQGKIDSSKTYSIGSASYSLTGASGSLKFNRMAPYLGLGWDTTFGDDQHWGFTFDLGVLYSGSPHLNFQAQGPGASLASFAADLEKERRDLESEIADFRFWPVISTGIVYQF